jgi:DmsE family decaheme c-type cytochrome
MKSLLFRTLAGLALVAGLVAAPAVSAADADRTLAGDAVCTKCHDEAEGKPILAMYKTRHGVKADKRTPGCQSCHGPSEAHVKNAAGASTRPVPDTSFGGKVHTSIQEQSKTCLTCHSGGQRPHWDGSKHEANGVGCTNCHAVHTHKDKVLAKDTQPDVCTSCHATQRAQIHRISTHPIAAGKMGCSDCHNPHGSTGDHLMKNGSVNDTCYTCHAEKRGPFLFEHEPVTDNCANCHTPHGSNTAPLLKTRTPWLCQNCHSGDHGSQADSAANLANGGVTTLGGRQTLAGSPGRPQLAARNCLNCHTLVHGSNHPAGAKFSR